jgi:hypothetical protein
MAGDDGLCAIHGGRQDPREIGRRGGSVGHGNAARRRAVLESKGLRELLRTLDPQTIRDACEEVLASGNLTAKVQVVRFLTDLELYRKDEDPEQNLAAKLKVAAAEFDRRFAARLERHRNITLGDLRDDREGELSEGDIEWLREELKRLREVERRYRAIPDAIRREHSA